MPLCVSGRKITLTGDVLPIVTSRGWKAGWHVLVSFLSAPRVQLASMPNQPWHECFIMACMSSIPDKCAPSWFGRGMGAAAGLSDCLGLKQPGVVAALCGNCAVLLLLPLITRQGILSTMQHA